MSAVREPGFAGTWYSSNAAQLSDQIGQWVESSKKETSTQDSATRIKAVIGPHAGYRYSGPTAAFSYAGIDPASIDRVILLGPSHRAWLPQCGVTNFAQYETPFGRVDVDRNVVHEFKEAGVFDSLEAHVDEGEHSVELHVPFVQHAMGHTTFKIVPILTGSIGYEEEKKVGEVLSKYLEDPRTLIAVSTDFCHWGGRFGYTHHERQWGEKPWQSIEQLDRLGIEAIKSLDPMAYHKYQKEYKNTICGRTAVSILMHAVDQSSLKDKVVVNFPKYDQSNHAKSVHDSSVSYAAGVMSLKD